MQVPNYRQLLQRTDGPPGSSWGLFGKNSQLGTLNFITQEITAAATRLVQSGRTINLDYPINAFVPSIAGTRPPTEHRIFSNNPNHRDDWLDSFYLQSTSQIDGLRHMRHPVHGFYDFVDDDDVRAGSPAIGIQGVSEKGVLGRGVLIDLPRYYAAIGRSDWSNDTNFMVTPDDLLNAAAAVGIEFQSGDILVVNTDWAADYLALDEDGRAFRREHWGSPGLEQSDAMVEFLWDTQFSMVVSDNAGVEAFPVNQESGWIDPDESGPALGPSHNGMLHRPLIALLGMFLGECWKLDELVEACAEDGRYEFLLAAKPLNVVGGVGSPPNAMAVK
jgi:hypothetical protein